MISKQTENVIKQLKKSNLSLEDRTALTACLLDTVQAIPIQNIITFDAQGTININGKALDVEQSILFRDSAMGFKDSFARKVINDQVTYEALKLGIHQGLTPDMIMFSKAILWVIQEEEKLLSKIIN